MLDSRTASRMVPEASQLHTISQEYMDATNMGVNYRRDSTQQSTTAAGAFRNNQNAAQSTLESSTQR